MQLVIGKKDKHLESLLSYFEGQSITQRKLYIFGGETNTKYSSDIAGYLIYKKTDGTNILIKLHLGEDKWEKEYQKQKEGKIMSYFDYCK
ncbi:hypothetical protein ACJROX_22965 [Pseudalkalibacillus sp. A8]|uniref:hypothetical protein n=1 Tax=Pseudalkalibacillus sp. A8 TaxID=3382641 RepID=UPI0038B4813B